MHCIEQAIEQSDTARPNPGREPRRWRPFRLALVFGVFLSMPGCVSTARPPAAPDDPVATFVMSDSMHCGLVLPRSEGGFVEYGYGDWDWYAEDYDSWYHVFDTLLWPTQGTLGRRLTVASDGDALRKEFHWMEVYELVVASKDLMRVRAELGALFQKGIEDLVLNRRDQMSFVPHDDGYWMLHNCNDEIAEWLEQLGCEVSWALIRVGLRVEQREGHRKKLVDLPKTDDL